MTTYAHADRDLERLEATNALRAHFGHVIDALPRSGRLALADRVIANAKRDGTTYAAEVRSLDRSLPQYLSLFDYVATLPWETDR